LTYFKTVTYAGWYLAETEGYFAPENITSKLLAGGPNLPPIEGLVAGGRVDVGMGNTQGVALANAKGADLVMFAAQFQSDPGGMLSLAKNPVRNAEDLVGKRIGITAGGGAQQRVDAIFEVNNLPRDYKRVRITGDPQALVDGDCDVMAAYVTAQPIALEEKGLDPVAVTLTELGLPDYGDVLFAERGYYEKNKALLAGYLRAVVKGFERNEQDPLLAARIAVRNVGKELGTTEKQALAENQRQIPLMKSATTEQKGLFWLDLARIEGPIYAGLRATGVEGLPEPRSFVDLSVLEQAFGGKRTLLSA
jgi:ABC-type nitrate/sulfonate/bicarbonate transport system substrate-binding protein